MLISTAILLLFHLLSIACSSYVSDEPCSNSSLWTQWFSIDHSFSKGRMELMNYSFSHLSKMNLLECFPLVDIEFEPKMTIDQVFNTKMLAIDLDPIYFSMIPLKQRQFRFRLCCSPTLTPPPRKVIPRPVDPFGPIDFVPGPLRAIDGSACGHARIPMKTDRNRRIVGGLSSEAHQWPWMVFLEKIGPLSDDREKFRMCGGTVIDRFYVLTAATCIGKNETPTFKIVGAIHDRTSEEEQINNRQLRYAARVHIHPAFQHGNESNFNVALIRVDAAFKYNSFLQPICLLHEDIEKINDFIMLGWGKEKLDGPMRNTLKQAHLSLIMNCKKQWPFFDQKRHICARSMDDDSYACHGDVGGPLLYNKSGQFVIAGIYSHGFSCSNLDEKEAPTIFTRVSAFINWIRPIVQSEKL